MIGSGKKFGSDPSTDPVGRRQSYITYRQQQVRWGNVAFTVRASSTLCVLEMQSCLFLSMS
eukprot:scaffold132141_cov16-Prasinocladus_malaysianus.AAC.1